MLIISKIDCALDSVSRYRKLSGKYNAFTYSYIKRMGMYILTFFWLHSTLSFSSWGEHELYVSWIWFRFIRSVRCNCTAIDLDSLLLVCFYRGYLLWSYRLRLLIILVHLIFFSLDLIGWYIGCLNYWQMAKVRPTWRHLCSASWASCMWPIRSLSRQGEYSQSRLPTDQKLAQKGGEFVSSKQAQPSPLTSSRL